MKPFAADVQRTPVCVFLKEDANLDDRTGVMMSAALMMIAAMQGNDEDVRAAKKGDPTSLAYLAGRYGAQACQMVDSIKQTLMASNAQKDVV